MLCVLRNIAWQLCRTMLLAIGEFLELLRMSR